METSAGSRLGLFLKFRKTSQGKLAEMLNTSRTAISGIITETRPLTSGMLARICSAFPDLNKEWLLSGEGDMIIEQGAVEETKPANLIPFYDVETTGGYSGRVAASDFSASAVGFIDAGGWFAGKETAAIRHTGDSMIEYPNGCILAVKEVTDRRMLIPGKNYVIETSEYRVTKRVQLGSMPDTIKLYSTNREKYEDGTLIHQPFELHMEDVRKIFYVLGYIVNETGEIRIIR